ncbi:DUF3549 family protein [Ferrimonas pelagia]|uniref:DUF3549 family protein n=1 Tax=Ferrimonas pelagia TaxID=1177826 RepID=A0ABP9EGC5_9GAMM
MESINTLDQFLTQAGTQYQVFDLGRRVVPFTASRFRQFEEGTLAYPWPRAGHAWLGVVFWQPSAERQHYVWFLKLPLDEQGFLNPAARSQFLQMVIEALGHEPAASLSAEQQDKLSNNPFTFTPPQEKMAMFHAQVRLQLVQPASVYYEAVQHYLTGQGEWCQWQHLGLQGFADHACRASQLTEAEERQAILSMPLAPLQALASVTEHTQVRAGSAAAWWQRAQTAQDESERLIALRALAGDPLARQQAVDQLLSEPTLSQEAIIAIAARLWQGLDSTRLHLFMEKLALYPGHLFNQIYCDLVAIPQLRPWVLATLRAPNRSAVLKHAIAQLMTALRGS